MLAQPGIMEPVTPVDSPACIARARRGARGFPLHTGVAEAPTGFLERQAAEAPARLAALASPGLSRRTAQSSAIRFPAHR